MTTLSPATKRLPEVPRWEGESRYFHGIQQRVLQAIALHRTTHAYPPTRKELQHALRNVPAATLHLALKHLQQKHVVDWDTHRARTLIILYPVQRIPPGQRKGETMNESERSRS